VRARADEICASNGVVAAHVINNAYGVQASKCVHQVELAMRAGRVDAVVQSLDKNFMVPVGGAIVCSSSREVVDRVAKFYPGRASATPTLDFFITMLQMVGLFECLLPHSLPTSNRAL
jgi:O-phospho-L-seryl-tRNASec:L-selenocysteinyl-tRNA synthase